MLAKRVAAEFLKGHGDPPIGVKLVFHFVSPEPPTDSRSVSEADRLQLELAKIASDLLYSILQQDGNLFDGCKAELGKQGNRFFTNPYSVWKVLEEAIKDSQRSPVYILIDGVDGLRAKLCKELIGRITGLMNLKTWTVKIFLSSRDVPHVLNNLPNYTKINLDIANSFVQHDLEVFIRRRLDALNGWDSDMKSTARETLLAKAEGTFLWVSLAIDNLTCHCSGTGVGSFLSALPPGLKNIYQNMLDPLSREGEPKEVLNIIRSVALALRPLTFSELGYILAWTKEQATTKRASSHGEVSTEIQPKTEPEIERYVRSSRGFLRATTTTVSLVHSTAIEYLFDENRSDNLPVLSRNDADLTVSWECFQYLHHAFGDPERFPRRGVTLPRYWFQNSNSGQGQQKDGPEVTPWEVAQRDPLGAMTEWPCLKYAVESWFIHARRSIEITRDNFHDDSTRNWLRHQFFETSDAIRKPWIELCGDPKMQVLAGEQTQLHIAVCLGLLPLVEMALSDSARRTNSSWSPLHLAAKFMSGLYDTLITTSEPPLLTARDQNNNTPLHEAAISGHWLMLVGLVKKFATLGYWTYSNEINKKNHHGNTPLHLAFQFDHPSMVEFLSRNGADRTIKNNDQLTASELGSRLGREDNLCILNATRASGIVEELERQELERQHAEEQKKRRVEEQERRCAEELARQHVEELERQDVERQRAEELESQRQLAEGLERRELEKQHAEELARQHSEELERQELKRQRVWELEKLELEWQWQRAQELARQNVEELERQELERQRVWELERQELERQRQLAEKLEGQQQHAVEPERQRTEELARQ